jgi:DNA repair exonuclease SbcCD ATPase subunit
MSDRDMHPVFERLRRFVNTLEQEHTADRPIRKDGLIESSNDSPNTGPPPNEECSVCGCTRCDWHARELAALRQQLADEKTEAKQWYTVADQRRLENERLQAEAAELRTTNESLHKMVESLEQNMRFWQARANDSHEFPTYRMGDNDT